MSRETSNKLFCLLVGGVDLSGRRQQGTDRTTLVDKVRLIFEVTWQVLECTLACNIYKIN